MKPFTNVFGYLNMLAYQTGAGEKCVVVLRIYIAARFSMEILQVVGIGVN